MFFTLPWYMTKSWRCSVSVTLYVFCVCLCLILCFLCYSVTCTVFFMLHVCRLMCVFLSLTECVFCLNDRMCEHVCISDIMYIFCLRNTVCGHVCVWQYVRLLFSDTVCGHVCLSNSLCTFCLSDSVCGHVWQCVRHGCFCFVSLHSSLSS